MAAHWIPDPRDLTLIAPGGWCAPSEVAYELLMDDALGDFPDAVNCHCTVASEWQEEPWERAPDAARWQPDGQ